MAAQLEWLICSEHANVRSSSQLKSSTGPGYVSTVYPLSQQPSIKDFTVNPQRIQTTFYNYMRHSVSSGIQGSWDLGVLWGYRHIGSVLKKGAMALIPVASPLALGSGAGVLQPRREVRSSGGALKSIFSFRASPGTWAFITLQNFLGFLHSDFRFDMCCLTSAVGALHAHGGFKILYCNTVRCRRPATVRLRTRSTRDADIRGSLRLIGADTAFCLRRTCGP